MYRSAQEVWSALDGKRQSLLTRVERYAALTIPKVLLPTGFDHDATDPVSYTHLTLPTNREV